VLRATDSQNIDPSQFAAMIRPGMVLEMSIVLRQKIAFQSNTTVCPRCDHVNLNVAVNNSWIAWLVLFLFHLALVAYLTSLIVASAVLGCSKLQKPAMGLAKGVLKGVTL
jgi:hypothetical protein